MHFIKFLLTAIVVFASAASTAQAAALTGRALWRERMVMPKGARLVIRLQDVSRADAPARTLAQRAYRVSGLGSAPFRLTYNPRMIDPRMSYALAAQIKLGDRLLFTTDTRHLVLTQGAPATIDLMLTRVQQSDGSSTDPRAIPARSLIGPKWVAEYIGERPVLDRSGSRLIFSSGHRFSGNGGCNAISGAYSATTSALNLQMGKAAMTMMACSPAQMDQERRFIQALGQTQGFRIERGQLHLTDANGATLIRFGAQN